MYGWQMDGSHLTGMLSYFMKYTPIKFILRNHFRVQTVVSSFITGRARLIRTLLIRSST